MHPSPARFFFLLYSLLVLWRGSETCSSTPAPSSTTTATPAPTTTSTPAPAEDQEIVWIKHNNGDARLGKLSTQIFNVIDFFFFVIIIIIIMIIIIVTMMLVTIIVLTIIYIYIYIHMFIALRDHNI